MVREIDASIKRINEQMLIIKFSVINTFLHSNLIDDLMRKLKHLFIEFEFPVSEIRHITFERNYQNQWKRENYVGSIFSSDWLYNST